MAEPIFVDGEWVKEHTSDSSVLLVDVRPPHFYAQGHLPGAINLPVFLLLGSAGGPPEAQSLASALGRAGITRETHVVAYDDGASPNAAILFWILAYCRHPAASILDGGITKWRHDGEDVDYLATALGPEEYDIHDVDSSVLARLEDVREALGREDAVIVDVRAPAEYLGFQITAAHNGHIPGAVNIDWSNNLDVSTDGVRRHRPDDELRGLYRDAGVTPDKHVIVHCQSGARSAETFAVLKKLGYPRVAHYLRGWQEWGNRQDTPVEEE